MWRSCVSNQQLQSIRLGTTDPYVKVIIFRQYLIIQKMSEIADSMIFRQKLYQTFKQSGLLSKLKTTLRTNLLQKLERPAQIHVQQPQDKNKPFHLRNKFLESAIAEYLRANKRQYSLSIFMAQCDLQQQDCLRFGELSQVISLNSPADGQSFMYRLFQQFGKIKCMQARERSTQTDFEEPLAKKLEIVQKDYRAKIDYWRLIPGSNMPKSPDLVDQEERLRGQFAIEKERIKKQLQVRLKQEIQKKLENQYNFRLHDAKKQHQTRLSELKLREKTVLDRLTKQKSELQEKAKAIREDQRRMINKYEEKMLALEAQYRLKQKQIEAKQKQFWKKELELRAKKRQYQETIRLVKQKVIAQSSQ